MLDTLKFVQSAVARKDFVPTLTHFRISNGSVLAYNGEVAISNPIDLNLECCPRAADFTKAILACRETIQLQLLKNGKLSVRSGAFEAFVPCLPAGEYPDIVPEGNRVANEGGRVLGAFKELAPFIAEDASRPWARGILFREGCALATNNIVVVQRWLNLWLPFVVNIPHEAVKLLLKVDQAPTAIQVGVGNVTFHYGEGCWIRCQMLPTDWPDLNRILDQPSNPKDLPPTFFQALEDLLPFADELERCFLHSDRMSTAQNEGEGAAVAMTGLPWRACFNLRQLYRLRNLAQRMDLDAYARNAPSMFFGDEVRGAIVGISVEGWDASQAKATAGT